LTFRCQVGAMCFQTVEEQKNFEKVTGGIQPRGSQACLDCDGMFVSSYAIFYSHSIHSSSSQ
jgi:hypothetical protein